MENNHTVSWKQQKQDKSAQNPITIQSIVCDITGQILYTYTNIEIYKSTNQGNSWKQINGNLPNQMEISSITCNEDGNILYISAYDSNTKLRNIYISNDGGSSYTHQAEIKEDFTNSFIVCNAHGNKLGISINNNGSIYLYLHGSWEKQHLNTKNVTPIVCNNEGTVFAFCGTDKNTDIPKVYVYKNNGWNTHIIGGIDPFFYSNISCNQDGSVMVVCGSGNFSSEVYVSTDYGSTWSRIMSENYVKNLIYSSIVCNAIGNEFVYFVSDEPDQNRGVYLYSNSHPHWVKQTLPDLNKLVFTLSNFYNVNINNIYCNRYNTNTSTYFLTNYVLLPPGICYIYDSNQKNWINKTNSLPLIQNSFHILSNDNGSILYMVGNNESNLITTPYVSYNQGKSWTYIKTTHDYNYNYGNVDLTCNSNGNQLIINKGLVYSSGQTIYITYDYGAHVTQINLPRQNEYQIKSIANNGLGNLIVMCGFNFNNTSALFISKDAGKTFTINEKTTLQNVSWNSICCNQEGNVIAVCGNENNGYGDGLVYISFDGGASWNPKQHNLPTHLIWTSIVCNGTGSIMALYGYENTSDYSINRNYSIYMSYDIGLTWTESLSFIGINLFRIKRNNGHVFTNINLCMNIAGLACCVAYQTEKGSQIQITFDSGETWSNQTYGLPKDINTIISGISIIGSGDQIFATYYGTQGGVFIGEVFPHSNICFGADTLIFTDQGYIPIEHMDPEVNTMNGGRKIVAVTKTRTEEDCWVKIKKHALGKNMPFQNTLVSKYHEILYDGQFILAYELIEEYKVKGVKYVPYEQETMYNVLLRTHTTMVANGLTCETLDPRSKMAEYFKRKQMKVTKKLVCK
jgi:photosystem II stability/assembly factor-like uncharacterized protein